MSLNVIRIPGKYLQQLANMSREQRRRWVKKNKKLLEKACKEEDEHALKQEETNGGT